MIAIKSYRRVLGNLAGKGPRSMSSGRKNSKPMAKGSTEDQADPRKRRCDMRSSPYTQARAQCQERTKEKTNGIKDAGVNTIGDGRAQHDEHPETCNNLHLPTPLKVRAGLNS